MSVQPSSSASRRAFAGSTCSTSHSRRAACISFHTVGSVYDASAGAPSGTTNGPATYPGAGESSGKFEATSSWSSLEARPRTFLAPRSGDDRDVVVIDRAFGRDRAFVVGRATHAARIASISEPRLPRRRRGTCGGAGTDAPVRRGALGSDTRGRRRRLSAMWSRPVYVPPGRSRSDLVR